MNPDHHRENQPALRSGNQPFADRSATRLFSDVHVLFSCSELLPSSTELWIYCLILTYLSNICSIILRLQCLKANFVSIIANTYIEILILWRFEFPTCKRMRIFVNYLSRLWLTHIKRSRSLPSAPG